MRQKVEETPDWMFYRVKLDGEYVDTAIEADDQAGYVVVLDRVDWLTDEGTPIYERREGQVELIDLRGVA